MSIKSDRWIREQAVKHRMIEPFSEKQVAGGVISYGLSSYGYDLRVSDEFKIFTNVNSAMIDPKAFDERSFVSVQADSVIVPPNSFALARSVEYFRIPRDVLDDLRGEINLCALRDHRERDAFRARMGRICHAGDLQHHAAAGKDLRQRRSVPDFVFPVGRALRDQLCRPERQVSKAARYRSPQALRTYRFRTGTDEFERRKHMYKHLPGLTCRLRAARDDPSKEPKGEP